MIPYRFMKFFNGRSLHDLHTKIILLAALLLSLLLLLIALSEYPSLSEQGKEETLRFLLNSFVMGALLLFGVWILLRFITYRLQDELVKFLRLFQKALTQKARINPKEVRFLETKALAREANTLIATLQELNEELEGRVQEKTESLKKRNQELKEMVLSQDRFLKNAIHDIYTPLSVIYANTDLLELKIGDNPHLHKIEAAAKSLHNIYSDLSYLIKKERESFVKERVDLCEFIRARVDYFREIAEGNRLTFSLELEGGIFISFSPLELERLCDNTLSNALKYSHESSVIKVLLKKEGNYAILRIINQGRPIQNPSRLFERYYREDEAKGGFGLGLSIIQEIAEKNGVSIEVDSQIESGTSFAYRFTLEEER
ncbi:sensor histidine kinase [Wolinella succinogenes]|uniref:sensor histidine kinase n=1 Tax=Wolinella succinogenes TaxID=844 RepID=UPI000ECD811A|nr:HAMP domain-containing sensor histidine kinase [Wolinella succinogenes]NLU35310.1 HAMP domain-containing histidine kinase [Wolinella succinogenes]HCZ18535.1 hypothetical protein [Helicobacter sp.]